MKAAIKYRFYPTLSQETLLAQSFGCARKVWNLVLDASNHNKEKTGKGFTAKERNEHLAKIKKMPEYSYLNEVSSVCLQQKIIHLGKALDAFFSKRAGLPVFKRKHHRQSITMMKNSLYLKEEKLYMAKSKEPLNIRLTRELPVNFSSATISKTKSGKYHISFVYERENTVLPESQSKCGIDLGLKDFLVFDNGVKIANEKKYLAYEEKMKFLQRKLAKLDIKRKKLGLSVKVQNKNRNKLKTRIAKLHEKISNIRKDNLHKITKNIVNENQVICVESLQIKSMVRNRRLARVISDASWGEFLRQLEYKCEWYGRTLVKVGKFYPSSKTCSSCNYIMPKLPLNIREWSCPQCNTSHDRDINAAINIRTSGLPGIASGVNP